MWDNYKDSIIELVKIVVISAIIILPIRFFLIHPFIVKGISMEETFSNNDYLIINRLEYRFDTPRRGDIIVFRSPLKPKDHLIKRVIGMPGDTVKIKDGYVYIYNEDFPNGKLLDESQYLAPNTLTYPEGEFEVREDYYFVLGDNRTASMDSRIFEDVSKEYIVGKVWLRGWPFDSAQTFDSILYPAGL